MNVFFTSNDGQVWVNKAHLKEIIHKELKALHPRSTPKRFADLLIGYLNTLYYKEDPNVIKFGDPDVDYYYCGSCRRGFVVRYGEDDVRLDIRPCKRCGAQAYATPQLGEEENDEGPEEN